jgi:putative ABC transport system ATP-binding protein
MARRRDPDAGRYRVGEADATSLDPAALRRTVLVADHDADLFGPTVLDDVRASAAPSVDLDAVLAATGADEVLAALPSPDASIGERGRSLSGGQRQRVALARAVAADRPVLVLHDPTTAVDSVTEAGIAHALRRLRDGRTTIVVTTSPALLAVCDRVVVLADGRVVEEGRHDQLLAEDGYRRLVAG